MSSYILIRNYKPGDEYACHQIVREAVMSTITPSFFNALTKEITLQLVVIMAAVMFVFLGLPPSTCLLSIPVTVVSVYIGIYIAHTARAFGMLDDVLDIPRHYMSTQFTGFWVAEAFDSPLVLDSKHRPSKYIIIRENDLENKSEELNGLTKKIVGTIAVTRSKLHADTAWLRRMAVSPKYQRKGIATALLKEVIEFCAEKGYDNIELITTECHDAARELYMKNGFDVKQLYHKQIVGSVILILMYNLTYKIPKKQNQDGQNQINKSFILTY